MNSLFAGTFSTGVMACWLPLFLHAHPGWKSKVIVEVETLLSHYSPALYTRHSSSPDFANVEDGQSLSARLARIPPEAWESETPIFDTCLRETIRLCLTGVFTRRVLVDELVIDGKVIKKGTFLGYPVGDVHHNPELYPDPMR